MREIRVEVCAGKVRERRVLVLDFDQLSIEIDMRRIAIMIGKT